MFKRGRALPCGASVDQATFPAGTSREQALKQTQEAHLKWTSLIREAVHGASRETLKQLLPILHDSSLRVAVKVEGEKGEPPEYCFGTYRADGSRNRKDALVLFGADATATIGADRGTAALEIRPVGPRDPVQISQTTNSDGKAEEPMLWTVSWKTLLSQTAPENTSRDLRVGLLRRMLRGGAGLPRGLALEHPAFPAGTTKRRAWEEIRGERAVWIAVIKEGLRYADDGTLKDLARLLDVKGLNEQIINVDTYRGEGRYLVLSLGSLNQGCRMQAVFTGAVRPSEAPGKGGALQARGQLVTRHVKQADADGWSLTLVPELPSSLDPLFRQPGNN